jgi:hypothetical protein
MILFIVIVYFTINRKKKVINQMGLFFPQGAYDKTANRVRFSAYEFDSPDPVNFVDLYTPIGFSLGDSASYSDFHLGAITSQVDKAFDEAKSAFEGGETHRGGRFGAALDSIGSSLADLSKIDKLSALTLTADAVAPQRVKDLIAYKTKRVVNPNTHTLFTGVSIRKFSFSFSLAAKSAKESDTINEIVKFFRKYLYPEVTALGMVSKFPVFWKVLFIYNNKPDNPYMPILHDCFLDSFSSNHNPDANSWHGDGSPVSTSFTLSFTESKTMHRESILIRDYKDPA